MKRSSKLLITAITVAGISLASIGYVSASGAYSRCGFGQERMSLHGPGAGGWGPQAAGRNWADERTGRMEQRLDMVKYKLRISEAQEPAWQAFEAALKQKMSARMAQHQEQWGETGMTVVERVERMRSGAYQMTGVADAIEQLYASLTPEQQKIADTMRPMGGMRHMR